MIEVSPSLYVGNELDFRNLLASEALSGTWAVVHACKEPHHRAFVGYTERSAPQKSGEYLFAIRGNRIALNMVDVQNPTFFNDKMINIALRFISDAMRGNRKVLVHCNQGGSRGPSLALLWLRRNDPRYAATPFEEGEAMFRDIYPLYAPADGIRGYVREHWNQT